MVRSPGPIALPSMNVYACLGETAIFSFPALVSCAMAAPLSRNAPPRMLQNVLNNRCLIRTHLPQATAQRGSNHSDHTDKGETVKLAKLTVPNDASASRHRPRGRRHRAVFP